MMFLVQKAKEAILPNYDSDKLKDLCHSHLTRILATATYLILRDAILTKDNNKTPCVTIADKYGVKHWHGQQTVTRRKYKLGGHKKKLATETPEGQTRQLNATNQGQGIHQHTS